MSGKRPAVLIEQWLPIAQIGAESQRERGASSALPPLYFLHVWWARRPLLTSRAAILGSLLPQWSRDWPAKLREQFPIEESYHQWFVRLLGILGDPVAGRRLIQFAREKGIKLPGNPYGYPRGFTVSPDESQIRILQDLLEYTWGTRNVSVMDPMAGGGSIPFEALRYGFTTYANELNPVASVILKATLEYPARYGPGLVQDITKWGKVLADRVADRLGPYFPRQDGENIFVYIWCRTIACPYTGKPIPLSPNWWLEKLSKTAGGREVQHGTAMRPTFPANGKIAQFEIVAVDNKRPFDATVGTIRGGNGISPWAQNQAVDGDYIKAEAKAGRMGQQLCAIGLATAEGRKFRRVTPADLAAAEKAEKELSSIRAAWEAKGVLPTEHRYIGPSDRLENYGQVRFADVFDPRQLFALGTVVEEFRKVSEEIRKSYSEDPARAEALMAYLAIAVDKVVDYNSRQAVWTALDTRLRTPSAVTIFDSSGAMPSTILSSRASVLIGLRRRWPMPT
jgi:putative DNA methylase